MPDKVEVIQADRERAQPFRGPLYPWVVGDGTLADKLDEAFAAHRIAHSAPDPLLVEALEPFAEVAQGEVWERFRRLNPVMRISSGDGLTHLTFIAGSAFDRARAILSKAKAGGA